MKLECILCITDGKLFHVMKILLRVLNYIGACCNIKFVFNFKRVLNGQSAFDNIRSQKSKTHAVCNY